MYEEKLALKKPSFWEEWPEPRFGLYSVPVGSLYKVLLGAADSVFIALLFFFWCKTRKQLHC
jgi:hypothetical protein